MARHVLVTGGTRGIGAGIACTLKDNGYSVIATYHGNDKNAQDFSKTYHIPSYKWDVRDFDACQKGVAEITEKYGTIDILINNAGITRDGFLHKMTPQMWSEVILTNLNSCFNMSRCVIEAMRTQGFGRIISVASINGLKGQMGQTNYSAAKAGVIGFTKALALESATKGITVNAIAPGYIDTEMVQVMPENILEQIVQGIPSKRLGTTDEIGRAVLFLAAETSGFINGATLNINGGQYMA
ncbi:MAG: acetoacetyl-CoA reductase [Alphaproteobacteria bacterium]|nr:acetoacetyl-CoA reductase [Alphaproteobacteria bacterium]